MLGKRLCEFLWEQLKSDRDWLSVLFLVDGDFNRYPAVANVFINNRRLLHPIATEYFETHP